jgi:hypothetical protein
MAALPDAKARHESLAGASLIGVTTLFQETSPFWLRPAALNFDGFGLTRNINCGFIVSARV